MDEPSTFLVFLVLPILLALLIFTENMIFMYAAFLSLFLWGITEIYYLTRRVDMLENQLTSLTKKFEKTEE